MSVGDVPYLIDPLYVGDMEPLGEILKNDRVVKILHAGDYDIRSLNRDYGFVFQNIFDTSIAAALMGSKRLGLGLYEDRFDAHKVECLMTYIRWAS